MVALMSCSWGSRFAASWLCKLARGELTPPSMVAVAVRVDDVLLRDADNCLLPIS